MERLVQKRSCQQQSLSSETEEQRAARLVQPRSCQQQRLSYETEEQRAARLVQLRNCQQQRLSFETTEEREGRLQRDADLHQRIRSINLALLKARGSTPRSPHTASLHVLEEQLKIFLHAPNNTASNALDWVLVHSHTLLPYSNDGLRIDNITCRLR